jgi:hypothetical protein
VAAVVPIDDEDYFSMRLANDPRFIGIIERSRARYKATGGISLSPRCAASTVFPRSRGTGPLLASRASPRAAAEVGMECALADDLSER